MNRLLSDKYALVYAFILQYLLLPAFFTIPTRLIIYSTSIILLIAVCVKNCVQRKLPYWDFGFFSFFLFSVYALIILLVHGDILDFGLGQILSFVTGFVVFSIHKDEELNDIFIGIAKAAVSLGLLLILGSFICVALVQNNIPFEKYFSDITSEIIYKAGIGYPRYNWLGKNPNTTGCYLFISSAFAIYLLNSDASRKWKFISIVVTLVSFIYILFSSRTSFACVLVFFLVYAFLMIIERNKELKQIIKKVILFSIVILSVFLLLGLLIASSDELVDIVLNKILRVSSLKNATGRVEIWQKSLATLKDNPLFGTSYLKLREVFSAIHAHNVFIQILSTTGIIVFILYLSFYLYSIYCSIRLLLKIRIFDRQLRNTIYLIISLQASLFVNFFFEQFGFAVLQAGNVVEYIVFPASIIIWRHIEKQRRIVDVNN